MTTLPRGLPQDSAARATQSAARPLLRERSWTPALRLLLAGTVLVPLLVLILWGERSWRLEHAHAVQEAQRNAELVKEFALGVIRTQEAVLDHASTLAFGPEADAQELHERLARLGTRFGTVLRLGVTDAAGTFIASSRSFPVRFDVSDRAYFRAVQAGTRLYLDRVILRPGGQDAVVVALRPPGQDFPGAVISAIPVEAFTSFFGRIAAGRRASASLIRADGLLLLRHTAAAPPVTLPPDAPAMRAIASGDSGIYEAVAVSDGIERIYGYARVGDLPLYANYGVAKRVVWEAWLHGMLVVGALMALIALLGFATVLHAARGLRAEMDRARLADAERRAEYQETLLRELHHRVKNSLMTVQSLIRLRGKGRERDVVLEQRVIALAQVHDLLHVSNLVSRLDLAAFLRALCSNPAIVPPERGIAVTCTADPVEVGIEQAVPLSLVVVELLTNALKHAFPEGRRGEIAVTLTAGEGRAVLRVRDNGVGLPEASAGRRNSGLRLVDRLAAQLLATLDIRREGGTEFILAFPTGSGEQPPRGQVRG